MEHYVRYNDAEIEEYETIELQRKSEAREQYIKRGVPISVRHQEYNRLKNSAGSRIPVDGGVLFSVSPVPSQSPPTTENSFSRGPYSPPVALTFANGTFSPQSSMSSDSSLSNRMSPPVPMQGFFDSSPRDSQLPSEKPSGGYFTPQGMKIPRKAPQQSTPLYPDPFYGEDAQRGFPDSPPSAQPELEDRTPKLQASISPIQNSSSPPLKHRPGQFNQASSQSGVPQGRQETGSSTSYSNKSSDCVSLPSESNSPTTDVSRPKKPRKTDRTRCKIEMHSSNDGQWYGLRATLDTGTQENWMRQGIVDRLGFSVKRGLLIKCMTFDKREFSSGDVVKTTWCTGARRCSYENEFRVIEKAPFDVLFGSNLLESEEIQWAEDEGDGGPAMVLMHREVKKEEKDSISTTGQKTKDIQDSLARKSKPIPRESKTHTSSGGGSKKKGSTKP